MKKTIFFFAALAALFSCAKENPVVETPAEETFSVELFASAPAGDAETKTTLVDGVDDKGKPKKFVHWSKGDAIKVLFFPDHTNSNTFNGPRGEFQSDFETETSEKAYFKTTWSWGFGSDVVSNRLMATGIAVYPSTAEATSNKTQSGSGSANNTELSFTLPNAQKAINGNIESGLNFSYAMVGRDGFKSAIESNRAMNLSFQNACALISLTMPASFEKDVTSVTISSNNQVALTGKGNVDMNYYKDEILSPFHVTPEVTETSHTVTLAKADGSALEAGATYFAVVWPGAHEGLTISFNAADGTVASKPTKAVTLTASMVKPYTFSSALSFETPGPKEYDYIYADGSMGNDSANAVGVIFYHGKPQDIDPAVPAEYSRGLAISLKGYDIKWSEATIDPTNLNTNLKSGTNPNSSIGGYAAKLYWEQFASLPYAYTYNYGSLPANASGWYHATTKEWQLIFAAKESLDQKLLAVPGGEAISNTTNKKGYWLPIHNGSNSKYSNKMWTIYQDGSASIQYYTYTGQCGGARPIFAF